MRCDEPFDRLCDMRVGVAITSGYTNTTAPGCTGICYYHEGQMESRHPGRKGKCKRKFA